MTEGGTVTATTPPEPAPVEHDHAGTITTDAEPPSEPWDETLGGPAL